MTDPLAAFAAWEGQPLGPDRDEEPGVYGEAILPTSRLHIAGAWAESGVLGNKPGVHLRLIVGAIGTGPAYHILDTIIACDVAAQLASVVASAARRAPRDLEAGPRL